MGDNRLRFRIAEYIDPPPDKLGIANKNHYFIEMGTPYREKIWWIFFRNLVRWEPVLNDEVKNKEQLQYPTFNEAANAVAKLKEQLPIYHEIV